MTELSDELLVAYVDGQLAHDQSKAVERVLEHDDIAAQRVHALRAAHTRLETAFDIMLDNEVSVMVEPPVEAASEEEDETALPSASRPRVLGPFLLACSAIALLMAGSVGGYALRAMPDPGTLTPKSNVPVVTDASARRDWQEDLIIAHALYGRDTLTIGLETQGNADLIGFQLANAVGTELVVPDLARAGLEFKRGQILNRGGEAIAQLSYLPKTGSPVSLYARWDKGADATGTTRQIDGISAAQWRQGNVTYLLTGRMPVKPMESLADDVRMQIAAKVALTSNLAVPPTAAEARLNAVDPGPPLAISEESQDVSIETVSPQMEKN